MRPRARILMPVALLLAAAAAWWVLGGRGADAASVTVASGTVEATEADLGFQLPGRVAEVRPREGDRVRAGQELAFLDRAELVARREAAEALVEAAEARLAELERGSRPEEVAQAEAAVRAARERSEDAAREAERTRRLHEGGAVSRETLDRATTAREVARADLAAAEERLAMVRRGPRAETIQAQRAAVRQARAALAQADASLEQAAVRAPFDGVVAVRHREPGEAVAAGAPVLTLRRPEERWVRIYVREDEIGRVRIGQPAVVTGDSHPGRQYAGEVSFIGSEAEFTPRNVQTADERTKLVFPVRVRITGDPDGDLKPGTPADVRLRQDPGPPPAPR